MNLTENEDLIVNIDSKIKKIGNGQIAYLVKGGQKKDILLIHGNSCGKEIFQDFMSSLPMDADLNGGIYSIDLPGCGDSKNKDYSLESTQKIIVEFCKLEKISTPIIIASSMGGHFALQLSSLLNASGVMVIGTPVLKNPMNIEEVIGDLSMMPLLANPNKHTEEEKIKVAHFFTDNEQGRADIINMLGKTDPNFRTDAFKSYGEGLFQDEVNLIKNSDIPILTTYGENDPLINQDYIESLGIETYKFEGADHLPMYSDPKVFREVVTRFTEQI